MPKVSRSYGPVRKARIVRKVSYKEADRNSNVIVAAPKARLYGMLNSNSTVYPFKRTTSVKWTMNTSTGFGALGFGLGINYSLAAINTSSTGGGSTNANLPNSAEFQALFDQYRINKVVLKIYFSNNTSTTASSTSFLPTMYVCNDNDNSVAPSTLGELQQRPESKLWQLGTNGNTNNIRTITVYPNAVQAQYTGTAFTSFGDTPRKNWLDCAYPAIPMYGTKIWWDTDNTSNQAIGFLTIVADIYYDFRGVQ